MKKKLVLLSILSTFTLLSACSGTTEKTKENNKSEFTIGVVADKSGIDDKSFNQATWEGVKKYGKEHNLKENKDFKYLESVNGDSDYIPNLTNFAQNGYDLIFAVGNTQDTAVRDVAGQFPDNRFVLIDAIVDEPNVASLTFKEQEGSFLAGVVAAHTTKSNKVGFVGGMESDLIKKFEVGFKAGVKSVNPNIDVLIQYAGAFDKPDKGQAIANSLYGQGVDVIYQAAGSTGNGIFTEAKNRTKNDKKVWVIGVDRDQYEEGLPENVTLTSMVKKVGTAVENVIDQTMKNEFPSGKVLHYGINEDAIGLSTNEENISEKAKKAVEEFTKKIKDGELVVPATEKEFKKLNF